MAKSLRDLEGRPVYREPLTIWLKSWVLRPRQSFRKRKRDSCDRLLENTSAVFRLFGLGSFGFSVKGQVQVSAGLKGFGTILAL